MTKQTSSPSSSDLALQDYFDALLAAPAKPAAKAALRPYAEPAPVAYLPPVAAPLPARQPAVRTHPVVAPVDLPAPAVLDAPSSAETEPERAATAVTGTEETLATAPAAWEQGRPQWAQGDFEALLFTVGGLNLAVPLVELGTIHVLDPTEITTLFGQAEWFMGMVSCNGRPLRVVDTAQVVMAERYQPAMRSNYRYVIGLNGTDWALAVDQVADALPLQPAQVRWRTARSQRPWLAGTVIDHMCALIDPAQLSWLFQQQDRRRRQGGGVDARKL